MISLRLYDGQVLTFADGTPEEVMRRMADAAVKRAEMQNARQTAAGQRVEGLDDQSSGPSLDLNPNPSRPGPSTVPVTLRSVSSGEVSYPRSRDVEIRTQPAPPDTSIADSIKDRGQRVDWELGTNTQVRDTMDAIEAKTGPLTDAWRSNVIQDLRNGKSIGEVMYNLQHYRRDSLGDPNFDIDWNSRNLPNNTKSDRPRVGPITPLPLVGPSSRLTVSQAASPDFSDVESGSSSTNQSITVRDDVTGQSFQFPASTPEPEIRRTIDTARSHQPAFDLSRLRPNPNPQYDLLDLRDQHSSSTAPNSPTHGATGPLGRSSAWWRSVTGSDNPEDWTQFARNADLQHAEYQGTEAMSKAGFLDRTTYYENPQTGERYPKHHKSGTMPGPEALDPQYRPGALGGLREAYDMEGRGWTSPETRAETGEFFSGLPARVGGSVSGAVSLPARGAYAAATGIRSEVENLPNLGLARTPTGESFRRGFNADLENNPIGRGAEIIQRNIVDPARERLLDASIRAGHSPGSVAALDTGQIATAEALNPVNYIGPGELIDAVRGSRALSPAVIRAADLEAQGGARTLESVPGMVTGEYGAGRAGSELAQARAARSGEFLPGAKEPLFAYNKHATTAARTDQMQGSLPDRIRELAGQSWRTYGDVPLDEPTSVAPKPRSVERDPLPMPPIDVHPSASDDDVRRIFGLWDYASRRYPRIASQVKKVQITGGKTSYLTESGVLSLGRDSDLGYLMHEMAHVAQASRGQVTDAPINELSKILEPYAVRAGDTYSRIPQPLPKNVPIPEIAAMREPTLRRIQEDADEWANYWFGNRVTSGDTASAGQEIESKSAGLSPLQPHEYSRAASDLSIEPMPAGFGGGAEGRAFTAWMTKNGINPDHAERYGELPGLRDQFFELHNPDPTPPREFYHPDNTDNTPTMASRAYRNVPDSLMGYGRSPKPYTETHYPVEQDVRITWPDGETHNDTMSGLNQPHAIERAYRNWPDASSIEPLGESRPRTDLAPRRLYAGGPGPTVPGERAAGPLQFEKPPDRYAAPMTGLSGGHGSIRMNFDVSQGTRVTEDQVRKMLPDLPDGWNYSVFEKSNALRPDLQNWHVDIWRPDGTMAGDRETQPVLSGLGGYLFADRKGGAEGWLDQVTGQMRKEMGISERLSLGPSEATPQPSAPAVLGPEAKVLPFDPSVPRRLYAGGPPPPSYVPRPEEQVAQDMGWVHPANLPGSPRAAVDPIRTAEFQTNLAAQLAGDTPTPESQAVAKYIVDRSDDVFRAIGPPQTWDTLEEMASRLGRTKESFLNEPSHWTMLAPEARLRLLYVIKGNESHITGLQAKLAAGAATDVEKADLLRAIEARGNLIQLGAKSGSAYGRALNSLKMEARLALDDSQPLRQQLYQRYSKQLDAEKPLMDALSRLDPAKPEELQAFLRHVDKPTLRQYIQEYWVASILSSPASHERNLIGNSVNAVMENVVVRPAAALWDAARTAGTQTPREVFFRETPQAILGMGRGLRQGLRRGLEVLRRGYDPETMTGKLFPVRSAFARSQNRVVREIVGPIVTMPLRMLSASDAVAKTVNWSAEIYAQAARMAGKEGLTGAEFYSRVADLVASPEPAMMDAANAFALKATFNDETSAVGKAIANIRDIPGAGSGNMKRGALPASQRPNPVVNAGYELYRTGMGFMLPFIHIADRLMVRGMEYSPVSFLTSAGARRVGNFAESADLAARASIGSIVMAYAASLAMEGRITGAVPENEGERAAFYGANKQPWSVRTEDGTWVPYGQLQPVGTPFALVASAYKGWAEHGEATDTEKLGHAAAQVGSYLTDQSYLDALSKMMDVISGGQTAGRAFSDVTANTAWGFVPYSGLTRTVARGVDPRVIDARTISDKLVQNVPGASLGLLGRLDPWGEEIVPVGGRKRAVLASGTVMLPSKEKANPLDQELGRVGMPLGYVGQTLTSHKKQIKLSDEEHYLYQQMSGRASRLVLQELFAREGWQDLDTETQRDEITKAVGAARKFGRIVVLRYHNGTANYPGLDPSLGLVRLLSGQKE